MLHLSPDILRATYNFLRETPPFKRWRLPEGDTISFRVTQHRKWAGSCITDPKSPVIMASAFYIGHTDTMVRLVAHEMVHLHRDRLKSKPTGEHDATFRRLAAQVCRYHGFDPRMF